MQKNSLQEKLAGYAALICIIGFTGGCLYNFIIWISNHFQHFLVSILGCGVLGVFFSLNETGWDCFGKPEAGRKARRARIAAYLLILAVVSLFVGGFVLIMISY